MVKGEQVTFVSGDLQLEGAVYRPDDPEPDTLVVVCHPHPQYGGDMYNQVVTVISRAAIEEGLGALVFNFRGVGESEGAFDGGKGERDDVRAALTFARSQPGIEKVMLAGYSFGAGMAAAAVDDSVAALALVALPPSMAPADDVGLRGYRGPVLLVSGSADHISPAADVRALAETLPSKPDVAVIDGADHFWRGEERALSECVAAFLRQTRGAAEAQAD